MAISGNSYATVLNHLYTDILITVSAEKRG